MAKPKMVVAMLFCFGLLGATGTRLIAQQNAGGLDIDPNIKALIEARIEAAKGVYESMQPARIESMEDKAVWSRRWMDEQIRLDPSPSKRLAAIQDHLDRVRGLEAIADQRKQGARGTEADILKMKYFRLDAEQMLAELRIINPGVSPPRSAVKP